MNCPCRSGNEYEVCCGRFIAQGQVAENAEQLMRSRYAAYVLDQRDYLLASWHPDYCPADVSPTPGLVWLGLQVLQHAASDHAATVEFEASFLLAGRVDAMHERSRFARRDGQWLYTDGDALPPTFEPWKPGRNDACPCGSGKKFKRCCA